MARINILILVFSACFSALGTSPKLIRICNSGTINTIYFISASDTCSKLNFYVVWGKDGVGGPFTILDTVFNKNASTHVHTGTNLIGWTYFLQYVDSCGSSNNFTDTIKVDQTPPDSMFFDSISVDIATNRVVMGWKPSKSPDFYRYLIYKDSAQVVDISPPVLRDTFYTDPNSDPQQQSIKYDLTASDSCQITHFYGYNPHSTIFLTSRTDTCNATTELSWSHYIGWAGIQSYYIYRSAASGPYVLVDSIPGTSNTYSDPITLGITYTYHVRAFKAGNWLVSSCSNTSQISTRYRAEPSKTYLANVTAVNPDANLLELTVMVDPAEEYFSLAPFYTLESGLPGFNSLPFQPISGNSRQFTFNGLSRTEFHLFRVSGVGLCGGYKDTSNVSNNIVIKVSEFGTQILLAWNRYNWWDNGVEKYRIFRGTNNNSSVVSYSILDSVASIDSVYIDASPIQIQGNQGVCYYVEAVQNAGSPHGIQFTSKSFSNCLVGDLLVFIPNAFTPGGFNKVFKPQGSFIDTDKSTMEIYNRWGERIRYFSDLNTGWDGNTNDGNPAQSGVYLYRMKIVSTNGQEQLKQGQVTLLN